jgi:hypothetical protein
MAVATTEVCRQTGKDHRADLISASQLDCDPKLESWLVEARRLFVEVQERLVAGQVLAALSSLAAVPPLHRMVVERCAELLDSDDDNEPPDSCPGGMYL